jgi:hypothetical protein
MRRCILRHPDYLSTDQSNDQFQQGVQSDLDMLLLEKMYQDTRREGKWGGGGRRVHATSGWRNRGFLFWLVLILGIYWFFLRPLGL